MIARIGLEEISSYLFQGKAIVLFGARQVGKTSLIKKAIENFQFVWLNGDEPDTQQLLDTVTTDRLRLIVGEAKILVIDEAQMIHIIGLLVKRMVDSYPEIQVIASGSSAFELADKTKESMVGRKEEMRLFPLTFKEMVNHTSVVEELRALPHRLVFGYYPEVVTKPGKEANILDDLTDGFLYKDILNLEGIKKSAILQRLVFMLAYRVGSEISLTSLANELGISRLTIEKYIDVLEKNFLIFSLKAYSNNQENELKKARKIYFWDNGLRNRIIKNFNPKSIRGNHAHKKTKQIFICIKGSLTINLSNKIKKLASVKLNEKNKKILFIMKPTWIRLENFSKDCIIMILADREYKSSDVIFDRTLIR